MNHNSPSINMHPTVLFVDMNSFFASCEQQVNYWLRNRPVGVCVYTGKHGCVIAPSIEAKKKGIKLGVRLSEAVRICPDLVPLETNPGRYREFHIKIMQVLRKYSDDVIPKSIDEAVVNIASYRLLYKDPLALAKRIKNDIRNEVGDWLKCSIGIAPNAFLAKLASDLQKPDGLVMITPENIDEVLQRVQLTDLPGINHGMEVRLKAAGILTPVQLRHTPPEKIRKAVNSIVGEYWHYRLNFSEMDMMQSAYKSMQAMRQISAAQRESVATLEQILVTLCTTLEQRMVKNGVYARSFFISIHYENGFRWHDKMRNMPPFQEGTRLLAIARHLMQAFEKQQGCGSMLNHAITSMGIGVDDFVPGDMIQCSLFEDNVRQDKLRKVIYDVKAKHGHSKLIKATELADENVLKDVIGFGSIKDIELLYR